MALFPATQKWIPSYFLYTTSLVLMMAFSLATPFSYAAVTTDKEDYSPGEVVTISGDGYFGNEMVSITVDAPYGVEYGNALTDFSGAFTWQFTLPNDESAFGDYYYEVRGLISGIVQSGTFTDGNVKAFPLPTNVTFTLTKTVYDNANCTGNITSGPTAENGVSDPSGNTTGVGNTESVKLQAASLSDQGTAFIEWTTADPVVSTSQTVVPGDTICVVGFTGGGSREYFANYNAPTPTATLTLQKTVVNDNGGTAVDTDWTLSANGPTPISGAEGDASITNAVVNIGAYDLSEAGPAGYTASAWVCVGGTQSDDDTVTLSENDDVVCTITNDDVAPTLTVTKVVVNDDGGTSVVGDFTLSVGGGNATTTVVSGAGNQFNAGNYTIFESGPAGYTAAFTGDCAADGSLSMAVGGVYSCTITNDDVAPTDGMVTVTKVVVNDNGGTAVIGDFTLEIGDGLATTTLTSGIAATIPAGNYTLVENGVAGYTGAITGDCAADGSITVVAGQSYNCTITNDDNDPSLTLQKVIINDDGGVSVESDWTLIATGPTGFSGPGPSVSNNASFDSGVYDLSETGPVGYTASAWVCVGGNQLDDDTIEIGLGDVVTCTITNDDNAVGPPPVPPSSCAGPLPTVSGIRIITCNRGSISNSTVSFSSTGNSTAGGSTGGSGGTGGAIVTPGGGSNNNGGTTSGSGGSGGAGGRAGFVLTGRATSESGTSNSLNTTLIRVGR